MGAFLVLVVCLLAGFGVARFRRLPKDSHQALDTYVIYLALPAIALANLHAARITSALLSVVAGPWLLFALSAVAFFLLARARGWGKEVFGALLLTAGLGNTSFVGLPMIQVFFGSRYKSTGIVMDQLGTYLILGTIGIVVAALCSGGERPTAREIGRRVLGFPPFLAVCAALALHSVAFPGWLQSGLSSVGATLAPVALFSVGMQLQLRAERHLRAPLGAALVAKLVVMPILVSLILVLLLDPARTVSQVAMFEVAMPPAIGGGIVAARYGLAGRLPNLIVGIGIPLSFLTLPLWSLVLHRL